MIQSKTQKIIKDTNGNEVVMIRVDKTLKEMSEEQPQSRWDVKYWHPQYENIIPKGYSCEFLVKFLIGNAVVSVDHFRKSKKESVHKDCGKGHPAFYYTVDGILPTGYDLTNERYLSSNGYGRLKRGEMEVGDVAIAISGVGSLGKIFIKTDEIKVNTTGDLYVLKIKAELINPFYVATLLKSDFGKLQIERNEKGVSGQTKLTVDMIENFLVPNIPGNVQKNIEVKYRAMSECHDQGMKFKKSGNEAEYKKHLAKANQLLKDLITRTEAVIRGERDDVI